MTTSSGLGADHGVTSGDVIPYLPARPDLDQLRHQAKDLLHAAQRGDPEAVRRISAVSDRVILSSAQLALAREYGFASWATLKLEVERRETLNSRDLSRLTRLLAEHPNWRAGARGAAAVNRRARPAGQHSSHGGPGHRPCHHR
jgi:hypothetical protein